MCALPTVHRAPEKSLVQTATASAALATYVAIKVLHSLALLQVGVPIARMCHHPSTGLLAVACDDLVIRMYDVEVSRGDSRLLTMAC